MFFSSSLLKMFYPVWLFFDAFPPPHLLFTCNIPWKFKKRKVKHYFFCKVSIDWVQTTYQLGVGSDNKIGDTTPIDCCVEQLSFLVALTPRLSAPEIHGPGPEFNLEPTPCLLYKVRLFCTKFWTNSIN